MLSAVAPLLVPLALTTGPATKTTPPYHQIKAYVTGYNTTRHQTDSTPCIAASGNNICGRHDAVACPRQIDLGTIVVIRGTTYVCEDRLARKFDKRFDISCDKDKTCPPEVTGWTVIKIYDRTRTAESGKAKHAEAGSARFWWARPMRAVAAYAPAHTSRTVPA